VLTRFDFLPFTFNQVINYTSLETHCLTCIQLQRVIVTLRKSAEDIHIISTVYNNRCSVLRSSHPTFAATPLYRHDTAPQSFRILSSCELPYRHSLPSEVQGDLRSCYTGRYLLFAAQVLICRNYVQLEKLGEGTYATVYKVSLPEN
jgi:hypothetical protein